MTCVDGLVFFLEHPVDEESFATLLISLATLFPDYVVVRLVLLVVGDYSPQSKPSTAEDYTIAASRYLLEYTFRALR